jgi:hypothetical protein
MNDEFDSLKKLSKKIAKEPSDQMMHAWASTPFRARFKKPTMKKANWWQLAAALIAGIIIGKFLLQTNPQIFSITAKNTMEDETFEYIYTNN